MKKIDWSDPPLWVVAPLMAPVWILGWLCGLIDSMRERWWNR